MSVVLTDPAHQMEPETELPGLRRLRELVSRSRPVPIAVVSGLAIVVFVALGIAQRTVYPGWQGANLDSEASVATWFSAALLWSAASCWLLVAATARPRLPALWIWPGLLAWLALDEGNALHERLERWSGIDWQLLYLPVLGIAAATWWRLVRRYRTQRSTVGLLVAGAAAWATALLLELIQNWGGSPVTAAIYDPAMITEEALEMIGSTMVLIAAIWVLSRSTRPQLPPG